MRSGLILLLFLLIPATLSAQEQLVPVPRLAVTVFTGARAPFATGFVTAFGPEGQQLIQAYEERQGGTVLGLDAEVGTGGPLRLLVGGSYSQMGRGDFFTAEDARLGEGETFGVVYGGGTWFAKAGLSYRLQSQPSLTDARRRAATDFFAAPALVRELSVTHPAFNYGFKGAFPVGTRGVEVMVGLEDYLVFWRKAELQEPIGNIFGQVAGAQSVEFLYDTSNRIVVRIGATLRL
ncbi:hypothetical protein BH23GEM6_BH23GEM6_18310 [soil metagenome]